MIVRSRFDPNADYVAARSFTYAGKEYAAGDSFDKTGLAPYHLNTLYGSRAVNMASADGAAPDPVRLTQTKPGYFEITAPWFDEPKKVRGKAKAEKRLAAIRKAGEPLNYRGVAIEESGGGWYTINAAWLEEPEKVQGFDEATVRANALREGGAPPDHYALVTVGPKEGEETIFEVSAPWLPGTEVFTDEQAAQDRADVIREAGPPEGWDPGVSALEAEAVRAEAEKASRENADRVEAERAEADRLRAFASEIVVSSEEKDGETTYSVSAPGLNEPKTFTDKEAADGRRNALIDAGPPEGWQPARE